MKLKNKRILITGGAKRLGRIFSLLVAREGGEVIIHHNQSAAEASSLLDEIRELGQKAELVQSDFSDYKSTQHFIDLVFSSYKIDMVINNASIFMNLNWETTNPDDWRQHQSINLESPFLISQAFAKSIKKNQEGRIVNILDWRALRPGPDHLPYTISKAGLAALTRSLAISLAPRITVNGIALGAILPPEGNSDHDKIINGLPISRWATTPELEDTLLFLLTGPNYITGEIIHLDGGRHLI
jgi:NAD(P)-dependent dehydrogenase (short-subunit alcohol dehydrogenase family)